MGKKTLVNAQTDQDVNEFLDAVKNKKRREYGKALLDIMKEITGKEPKIWGKAIVAFGKYKYQRKNGQEFEWFNVGFSPASAHTTLYLMYNLKEEKEMLDRLGPHKAGSGCLYIKSLADVDPKVLREVIEKSDRWERS